ncbi:hypothetical protein BSG1_08171 [Bacillus sp. SG-1]|nr:hypothetical protein BSG1_08171 [Bacillus sp. SG-1]
MIGVFSLAGCGFENNELEGYDSEEKAIEAGLLQHENLDQKAVLSIEEHKGETIVFFKREESLGTAIIAETKKGFNWYRNHPYNGFETSGNLPFSTVGFDLETKSGVTISILAGKVHDASIQSIRITDGGIAKELKIDQESGLFYAVHEAPLSSLAIEAIK